jgi:LysM repeat protein
VLIVLLAVPLVIAGLFALVNSGGAAASNERGSSLTYVTVQPGETLWQLAGEIAPSADPRDVISDIVRVNNLPDSTIQAGEQLAIPAQYNAALAR